MKAKRSGYGKRTEDGRGKRAAESLMKIAVASVCASLLLTSAAAASSWEAVEQAIAEEETKAAFEMEEPRDFIFPDAGKTLIKEEDLEDYPAELIFFGMTEILARKGMIFPDNLEPVNEFYQSRPWYFGYLDNEMMSNADFLFNSIEYQNLNMLQQLLIQKAEASGTTADTSLLGSDIGVKMALAYLEGVPAAHVAEYAAADDQEDEKTAQTWAEASGEKKPEKAPETETEAVTETEEETETGALTETEEETETETEAVAETEEETETETEAATETEEETETETEEVTEAEEETETVTGAELPPETEEETEASLPETETEEEEVVFGWSERAAAGAGSSDAVFDLTDGDSKTAAGGTSVILSGNPGEAVLPEVKKSYVPGTYSATAQGMGNVTVTMTFNTEAITGVTVDVSEETSFIGGLYGEDLADMLMQAQSSQIDTIAGATLTSSAAAQAAQTCITQALEGSGAQKPESLISGTDAPVKTLSDIEPKTVLTGNQDTGADRPALSADAPQYQGTQTAAADAGQIQQELDPKREYFFYDADKRYLAKEEVQKLTLQEVCYAKNEIYARHGRKFLSVELQEYFAKKSWYRGIISPDNFPANVFNDYEIANINTLVAVENEKSGNQGYQLDQAGYDITKVSTISLKN